MRIGVVSLISHLFLPLILHLGLSYVTDCLFPYLIIVPAFIAYQFIDWLLGDAPPTTEPLEFSLYIVVSPFLCGLIH